MTRLKLSASETSHLLILDLLCIHTNDNTSAYEPPHEKTNKMSSTPSEDSDQPGHPPSLIRVFAVRMKKGWILSYALSAQ